MTLPPLPEPVNARDVGTLLRDPTSPWPYIQPPLYTATQMHAYARAAVAAYREDAERLEWLATRSMYAGRAPLADGTRVWFTPEIDFVCVKPDANALRAAIDSARGKA